MRVQDIRLRGEGLDVQGYMVQSLKFDVQGLDVQRYRVEGLRFGCAGSGYRVQDKGFRI